MFFTVFFAVWVGGSVAINIFLGFTDRILFSVACGIESFLLVAILIAWRWAVDGIAGYTKKRKARRSALATGGCAYEPPPTERMHDQPASGATPPPGYGYSPAPQPGSALGAEYPRPYGHLTLEDVHNIAFSKPPLGKRGYNEDDVDELLELVEAALRNRTGLTPEDVRDVAFSKPPAGKRGYNQDEVDAFLDRVEEELKHRATGTDT